MSHNGVRLRKYLWGKGKQITTYETSSVSFLIRQYMYFMLESVIIHNQKMMTYSYVQIIRQSLVMYFISKCFGIDLESI